MICNVQNKNILIDNDDIEIFNKFKWHINDSGYVVWRGVLDGKKKTVRLHRLITHADDDQIVDHINRNKLDNRRCNLRCTTQSVNMRNTDRFENAKCYYFDNRKQRWTIDARRFGIRSLYMDSEEACKNYIKALKKGESPMRIFTRRTPKFKLGDKKEYILREKQKGRSDTEIANDLGVSYSAVHRIVTGETFNSGRIPKCGPAKEDESGRSKRNTR